VSSRKGLQRGLRVGHESSLRRDSFAAPAPEVLDVALLAAVVALDGDLCALVAVGAAERVSHRRSRGVSGGRREGQGLDLGGGKAACGYGVGSP
jgi:hypothetical protein